MKISHCKLLKKYQLRGLEFFVLSVIARSVSDGLGIQPNSAVRLYRKLRERMAFDGEQEAYEMFEGAVELDESDLGGVRKGKRGRGVAGKMVVFGILKRGGKVFTQVVNGTKTSTLMPLITHKIVPDSVVYSDSYRSYNVLDVSAFHHHRIHHSVLFAKGKNPINGIENFWHQAKRTLSNYNSIPKVSFPLFLKECEFKFNYGSPIQQLKLLKE